MSIKLHQSRIMRAGSLFACLIICVSSCDNGKYYEASKSVLNKSSHQIHIIGLKNGNIRNESILNSNQEWVVYQHIGDGHIEDPTDFFSGFEGTDSVLIIDNNTRDTLVTYYYQGLYPNKDNPDHDIYEKDDHEHQIIYEPDKEGGYGLYVYRFIILDEHLK